MNTYIAKMQIGEGDLIPFGSTLFGVCETYAGGVTKRVTLTQFDNLVHGITIAVKFTQGNTAVSGVKLQVGQTLAYPIEGDCTCAAGEVISFTFEEASASNKYWHAHVSGLSDNVKNYIDNAINTSTETPDVLIMKGSIGIGGNPGTIPSGGYEIGWTYRVITDGTYADWACKAGDLIIAIQNATPNQSTINYQHWIVVQSKVNNAVMGPNYAWDDHVAVFDGNSGEMIKDSGFTIATSVPQNAIFTDTTYDAGTGLELIESNQGNVFNVLYGTTAGTAAEGDHNHDSVYATISHDHGNILSDGTIGLSTTNALLKVTGGVIEVGPTLDPNDSDPSKFLSNAGTWRQAILSINGVTPDNDGTLELTASDLGISAALKFIGIVADNSTYQPSDGTAPGIGQTLAINGLASYTPSEGDIIIDKNQNREYIYDSAGLWESLGPDGDFKIIQTEVDKPENITNRWVSSIGQNANGEISVSYQNLDTSGIWSGNAATATAFETARELYVDLETTRNPLIPIYFDGTADNALRVSGILPIQHGGTGVDSFNSDEVVITNAPNGNAGASELITRPYIGVDRTPALEARALVSSDSFVTEATIYSGLPQINDLHNYTYESTYYAPVDPGTQYQILVSGTRVDGNTTVYDPEWAAATHLESDVITAHTTNLTLGNNLATGNCSDGILTLYSHSTGAHILRGDTTTGTSFNHTLQNVDGFILQSEHAGQVGSETQPIFIDRNGLATPLTYTINRLYYSASTSSFEATYHYADEEHLGVNLHNGGAATWPTENNTPILDVFYVNGSSSFDGVVHIIDTTEASHNSQGTAGALIVDGGTSIGLKLFVMGHTELESTLNVRGPVGINTEYDSNTSNQYILTIRGSTKIVDTSNNASATAFLDIVTATTSNSSLVPTINFYPQNDETGSIGLSNGGRWKEAYFSHLLQIGDASTGITADHTGILTVKNTDTGGAINTITLDTLTSVESQITITSANPSILLNTSTSNVSDWTILNDEDGIFRINNLDATHSVQVVGTDYGFGLKAHVYINSGADAAELTNSDLLDLYVNGTTELLGKVGIGSYPETNTSADSHQLIISGSTLITSPLTNNTTVNATHIDVVRAGNGYTTNIYPENNNTGQLGLGGTMGAAHRWNKVYIGEDDSYGDPYLPIYWNDGVPKYTNGVVQYNTFEFQSGDTSTTVQHEAYYQHYGIHTFVLQIVVTSGASNLNDVIDWSSSNSGSITGMGVITLTTGVATSGIVQGYIITARGCDLTISNT